MANIQYFSNRVPRFDKGTKVSTSSKATTAAELEAAAKAAAEAERKTKRAATDQKLRDDMTGKNGFWTAVATGLLRAGDPMTSGGPSIIADDANRLEAEGLEEDANKLRAISTAIGIGGLAGYTAPLIGFGAPAAAETIGTGVSTVARPAMLFAARTVVPGAATIAVPAGTAFTTGLSTVAPYIGLGLTGAAGAYGIYTGARDLINRDPYTAAGRVGLRFDAARAGLSGRTMSATAEEATPSEPAQPEQPQPEQPATENSTETGGTGGTGGNSGGNTGGNQGGDGKFKRFWNEFKPHVTMEGLGKAARWAAILAGLGLTGGLAGNIYSNHVQGSESDPEGDQGGSSTGYSSAGYSSTGNSTTTTQPRDTMHYGSPRYKRWADSLINNVSPYGLFFEWQ